MLFHLYYMPLVPHQSGHAVFYIARIRPMLPIYEEYTTSLFISRIVLVSAIIIFLDSFKIYSVVATNSFFFSLSAIQLDKTDRA